MEKLTEKEKEDIFKLFDSKVKWIVITLENELELKMSMETFRNLDSKK